MARHRPPAKTERNESIGRAVESGLALPMNKRIDAGLTMTALARVHGISKGRVYQIHNEWRRHKRRAQHDQA